MRTSLSRLLAPKRNRSGVIQRGPERLVQHDQVLDGLLGGPDAARRLHAHDAPGRAVEVADRLEHHERDRQRGGGRDLAGGGLDEVGAGGHRQDARAPDVVERLELAGLQDDLEVRRRPLASLTSTISSNTVA